MLWTKPSEMTFYAALGIPLILAPPLGAHERYNRRWALETAWVSSLATSVSPAIGSSSG